MSKFNTVRTGLLGSAAVFALLAVAPAQAVEAQFGEVSITFDTTVSMGASMLTQERIDKFLPEANGGPVDPRHFGPGVNNARTVFAGSPVVGAYTNLYTNNPSNFDGSANSDDGRLNFDRGDLIGANVKASHDLLIKWQNYSLFARGVGFYDVIMNDKDAGDHSQLTDQALGDVGRNYDLLDLFVSADYTIADLPVNLRVGKQVINWGESTFIQNGLNVFNPIDVSAIRKPGSEIKEALVPVNSIFASVSFPFQVSMSGWYALDFEPFEIDPSGTPFSGADVIASGSGVGGNQGATFLTASPYGANRRACLGASPGTIYAQTNGYLNDPHAGTQAVGNNLLECLDSAFVPNHVSLPIGQHELVRLGQVDGSGGQVDLSGDGVTLGTTGAIARGEDYEARDGGQFGIKASWFAEALNGTEFGLYYQNYHSRLPFVQIERKPGATTADLGFNLNGRNTDPGGISTKGLPLIGCGLASATTLLPSGAALAGQFVANATSFGALAGLLPAAAQTQMKNTQVSDPGGLLATLNANLIADTGLSLHNSGGSIGINNQYAVAQANCVLAYLQSGSVAALGGIAQTDDNAEFLLAGVPGSVAVTYPEDIDVFGFSFNTTLGGIGLQAEATYRPEAPFQVDTDSLTIASLVNGCVFHQLFGLGGGAVQGLATPDGTGVKPFCGSQDGATEGVIRSEMFTAQFGTTSQFTGSDWFIDMLGADIGTLVTEVGLVYTPGVEDTWLDTLPVRPTVSVPGVIYQDMVTQYQNTGCQGTDLPAGGILSLDRKTSAQCRPTDLSAGLVMLFTWSYNNFLDTGFAVAPRIVYSWDFDGTTAAPYSNYAEDRQAINLGVDGTLNNNFKMGVSYSNFFGGHVNNKSRDRDFASVSASYTF